MNHLPPLVRVGAYTVLVEDGRILLCHLKPDEPTGGRWTLPGGGVEFGEHPLDAAVREAREETGMEVTVSGHPHVVSIVGEGRFGETHHFQLVYRGEIIGGVLADEMEGSTDCCGWFTEEEARQLPLVAISELGVELAFGGLAVVSMA